jgi:hypothetical protein
MVDVVLVVAVTVFWFEVVLRGSFIRFCDEPQHVVCTLALGLFISTISRRSSRR